MGFYSIQLWSVRDDLEKDFEGTLKALKAMGYSAVEFAGFYDHSADEVKSLLEKYDLKLSGVHCPIDNLIDNYDETVNFNKTIGNKNYIIPAATIWNGNDLDILVEQINTLIPKLKKDGISLGYHNHYEEFRINGDGSNPYEQLIYRTDIDFEFDAYWAYIGMKNPIAVINRLGDRLKFIHLRDGTEQAQDKPLGMGTAPVKDVYKLAIEKNIPIIVESVTCMPSGLAEAKICIDYLKKLENQC